MNLGVEFSKQANHSESFRKRHVVPCALQKHGCDEDTLHGIKLACLIRPTDTVIQRQHLFTVYVHPSKGAEGALRKSVLYSDLA